MYIHLHVQPLDWITFISGLEPATAVWMRLNKVKILKSQLFSHFVV